MMAQANLPITYWGDALLTATFILNRVPTKSVESTPYELWTHRKPDLRHTQTLGLCSFRTYNFSFTWEVRDQEGRKCIFIRYSETSKGYVFIGLQDSGSMTEFESRDVTFVEEYFPKQGEISQDLSLFEVLDQAQGSLNLSGSLGEDVDVDLVRHPDIHLHLIRMKKILFHKGTMIQVGAILIQMGLIQILLRLK